MTILVTGAAGYIGSNLSDYLLAKKHKVLGIDNFNDFYNPRYKRYNIKDFKDNPNFTLVEADILDYPALEQAIKQTKVDAIIHLAAWAGVTSSLEVPVVYVRNNIEGTVNLAELAVKHKIGNFIFASTSSIYGDGKVPFTEESPSDMPLAPYPATKKACEVLLSTYNRNYGLNVTTFRIFNPLGLRLRPDLALPKLIKSCLYGYEFPMYWANPEGTGRDYTYLIHLFDAFMTVLAKPLPYEIFNAGNSQPVSLTKLIQAVEKVTGKKVNVKQLPERKGEMQTTYADITKAKKRLGYNPTTTMEQIVDIYYQWFIKQEEWYRKAQK